MNINKLPIPPAIAARLKDWRGYPIPFVQFIPSTYKTDKKVDFRVTDPIKKARCVDERLCGICGMALHPVVFFIGGEKSFKNQLYTDPAMHLNCARFAAKVCPFLVNKNFKMTPIDSVKSEDYEVISDPLSAPYRPEKMFIVRADDYKKVKFQDKKSGQIIQTDYIFAINVTVVEEF